MFFMPPASIITLLQPVQNHNLAQLLFPEPIPNK